MKDFFKSFLIISLFSVIVYCQVPIIRIISPLENSPIITNTSANIFGEVINADNLYLNNNKIPLNKGLFRITIPKQSSGKSVYKLLARNNTSSTAKEIAVVTLKTLLDGYLSHYKKEINILLTLDIIRGYMGTDFFKPDLYINKAELTQVLIKLHKVDPLLNARKYHFKDVFPNHWAYEYIQAALNKNLLEPKEVNFFGAESFVSRKELIGVLKGFFERKTNQQIRPFLDINYNLADEKMLSDVAIAGYLPQEWTNGKEIYPNRAVTRAELAYILSRLDFLRAKIKQDYEIDLQLYPVQKDLGEINSSLEISFSPMTANTYKIKGASQSERKIVYIELTFSDNYHTKNVLLADDGKGLDKLQGDNLFTSAVDLTDFNKNELYYEYKMFNAFNLIEEAGRGKINFSNGNLSIE